MLKLLIADDEKAIRESISTLIDWSNLDIELIGTAKNGIEAYNIILDQYPDIVLTDIKMPGLTGLDLIEKIYDVNKDTRFIILSGFNEFEYAKKAMQFGVRHYLLKPCTEEQIIQSIREIKDEYTHDLLTKHIVEEHSQLKEQFHSSLTINIINHYLAYENDNLFPEKEIAFHEYNMFLEKDHQPYEIFYLYYLEEHNFTYMTRLLSTFCKEHYPGVFLNIIYVHNTFLFLFPSLSTSNRALEQFCTHISFENQQTTPFLKEFTFPDLQSALKKVCMQIRRYERIYYTDGGKITTISNYNNMIKDIQDYTTELFSNDSAVAESALSSLYENIMHINNLMFLKQIASSIVITAINHVNSFSVVNAADFLLEIENSMDFPICRELLLNKINILYQNFHFSTSTGDVSDKIKNYVSKHLANSELSLKWIAENELYMNVDYISKRFVKETGQKFSAYLTETRVSKAKELLAMADSDKIQNIAELVGCGNNPQYFSQIFKKSTGMSPSSYVKKIQGNHRSNGSSPDLLSF
ncbi:MAG: response regulator [Lachnospiraceae bacterium]|nr:response regulator [Lachnospiraceae bacterium]